MTLTHLISNSFSFSFWISEPPKVYHQVLPTSNENSTNILPTSTDPDNQNLSNNPVVTKPLNINFSEFEAESDPFEKAELQTIDDLQELAAILTTTATSTFPTSSSASVYSTPSMMNTSVGAAGVGVQGKRTKKKCLCDGKGCFLTTCLL